MLSVAATYVFTMVLPYIKIGDVGLKFRQKIAIMLLLLKKLVVPITNYLIESLLG